MEQGSLKGNCPPPLGSPLGSRPVLVREPSDHRIPQIHRISAEITETALRNGPQLRTKAMGHYMEYKISLTSEAHASRPQCQWDVWKRYSEFDKLRHDLMSIDRTYGEIPFPGKSMFWNTAATVAKKRMAPLAEWLNATMQNKRADEMGEDEGARVAEAMNAFLQFSTHSQPPKASEKPPTDTDTVHNYTNPDLKFVSTIKRADSMHNWKKSIDKDKGYKSPKVGRAHSCEDPIMNADDMDA